MNIPQQPIHPKYPIEQFPTKREEKKEEDECKSPTYDGGRLTVFDLLTCIMFSTNLLGITDIHWLLVFLPFLFPYVVFYGIILCVKLWAKYKSKKTNEETKTN